MLLADVVACSGRVGASSGRGAKVAALAVLLRRLDPSEVEAVVAWLSGEPRQGRLGLGWATLAGVEVAPAGEATLEVGEVDDTLAEILATTGAGSERSRRGLLGAMLGRATAAEATFLRGLMGGDLRQGALEGVMAEAVAKAAGVPAAALRRACMLTGDLGAAATVAFADGADGLAGVRLEVLRPVQPMLASTAADVASALSETGLASVEWKLDGLRIQVHRRGSRVAVYSRSLNDLTERVPDVVAVARQFPADAFVLDGEAIMLGADGRPAAFAESMTKSSVLVPRFFDCLHDGGLHDGGGDLLDRPLSERLDRLEALVGRWRMPGRVTADPAVGDAVLAEALSAGHEGVVVKAATSPYEAGRRGKAWRKVKPAVTLDLVVLAAEWGHGRRQGFLSNIHLGAGSPSGFVMVGKTFKGMTDAVLAWQTEQFLAQETGRDGIVVYIRPEFVAEVAVDGVQRSSRYPGGVALRFARLRRYRHDKAPADADTIDFVRSLMAR